MHADLRDSGIHVSRKRVARLMRRAGLVGVSRRKEPRTTVREPKQQSAAVSHACVTVLVGRDFTASEPDRLWVGDITYVPTATGFLFLTPRSRRVGAVVLDAFSRRVVGWSMATSMVTPSTLATRTRMRA